MKRVLMLSNHPLLIRGVESLLRQAEGVEFIGRELDVDQVVAGLRAYHPDVIILDDRELNGDSALAIMSYLGEPLGIRVIGLSPQQNTICIYRGEQRVTRDVSDLVSALAPATSTDARLDESETINQLAFSCHAERSEASLADSSRDSSLRQTTSHSE